MVSLLSLIGKNYYYTHGVHYNYKYAKIFEQIYERKDPFEKRQMTDLQGLYLQEAFQLGKLRFSSLKRFLDPFVNVPNSTYVRNLKKSIVPKLETLDNSFKNGKWAPLDRLLTQVVKDTLIYLAKPELLAKIADDINVLLTAGFDGSGRHSEFRSCRTDSENLILGGIRLIEISSNGNEIYTENSLGSETEFPYFIGK